DWLKRVLTELHGERLKAPPVLFVDNAGAVKLAKNPEFHKRTKHIDVLHFYVRERYINSEITVQHVEGSKQFADILTKPLDRQRFETLGFRIGCSVSEEV